MNIIEDFIIGYTGSAEKRYTLIVSDLEKLSKQIIFYLYKIIKNFKFINFYDKDFIDAFKFLIKDKEEFIRFLNYTKLDMDEFLHLSIYICQNAFTSNLIKFIQVNYLNIITESKTKRKKKK